MGRFRLSIDSTLTSLFIVSTFVQAICERLGMTMADISAVEVCAVEAVTNAIMHAYLGAPGNEVSIEAVSSPGRLDLYVRDHGQTMPVEHATKLTEGSRVLDFDPIVLSSLPECGMGLQIIHQLMNEAVYSTENGENCLRITTFVTAAESREAGA